jgi:hypothetical protein
VKTSAKKTPPKAKPDFKALNEALTSEVVSRLGRAGKHGAVIAEAPPGAGKSTLTATVANALVDEDTKLRLAVVTQTNEQADDLVIGIADKFPGLRIARLTGGDGPSAEVAVRLGKTVTTGTNNDEPDVKAARIVVSTARKWQYERSRLQTTRGIETFPFALIDEAYQMRSDMLLGIADLFDTLFCVGDPGQLDPFTVIDDSLWKGLPYSPSRAALATLRQFHQDLDPLLLPTSWRLPPSAAGIVSKAFYPFTGFEAGTAPGDRVLELGSAKTKRGPSRGAVDADAALSRAAAEGWAYVELTEKFTLRTDMEIAGTLAGIVERLLGRGATVVDEMNKSGKSLTPNRIAVIAAHNDQVHAVRYELDRRGVDPDSLFVSTANKIQGREYDVSLVWHPLAGRKDATAFHLEAGRMCVMLSRHRQACIVVGRAGARRLLEEFPDADPVYLDEPEKFPDGWEANHAVLEHLEGHRVA